jgi:Flp pilus assembly pilin Flp
MLQWLRDRMQRKGQSMVEYAIILVLVAVVVMVAVATVGNQINATFIDIQEALLNPNDPGASTPYTCPDSTIAVLHGHKYHCQ